MSASFATVNIGGTVKKYGPKTYLKDLRLRLNAPDLYLINNEGVELGDGDFLLELGAVYAGHLNQAGEAQGKIIRVFVGDSNSSTTIQILSEDDVNLLDVVKQKLASSKLLTSKRKSGAADPYTYYKIYDANNSLVNEYGALIAGASYFYKLQENLTPQSGSSWDGEMLEKLKVRFLDVAHVTGLFQTSATPVVSNLAAELLRDLKQLDYSLLSKLKNVQRGDGDTERDKLLQDPLIKASFLARKYADHESIVDCFVILLLSRIGFFEEWLFAFPQLRLKLRFGAVEKEAIPDFVIMDVVSFLRMAVMEDKRLRDELLNSEPQLIAEMIALFQANILDKKEHGGASQSVPVLGVRVNGLRFYFYHIPDPSKLLQSMSTNKSANEYTYVNRLGGNEGLDFLVEEEREIIINTLDFICQTFRQLGLQSRRRDSLASGPDGVGAGCEGSEADSKLE